MIGLFSSLINLIHCSRDHSQFNANFANPISNYLSEKPTKLTISWKFHMVHQNNNDFDIEKVCEQ